MSDLQIDLVIDILALQDGAGDEVVLGLVLHHVAEQLVVVLRLREEPLADELLDRRTRQRKQRFRVVAPFIATKIQFILS